MKILNEKEIEYAANILCNQRFNLSGKIKYGDIYIQGIISGASFTEQKLIPLMVEFAEWIGESQYDRLWMGEFKGRWSNYTYNDFSTYTTQQLLEQFIKQKQDER